MTEKERMNEVIQRLEQKFGVNAKYWIRDPFQVLIATILSQNTSDRNSQRAFLRMKAAFDVKPQVLADLEPKDIKPIITIAGLANIRSQRIIEISREVINRFKGDIGQVFHLPLNEARETLMSMKGVGPKTADVLLAFAGGFHVMPVDTNIFRVTGRMGFARGRNYERTRGTLEKLIPPEKRRNMHFNLIRLGREICTSRKPRCASCPVDTFCAYRREHVGKEEG